MSGLVRFSTGSCTKWSSTLYVPSNHQFLGGNPVLLTMEILARSENLTWVGWAPTEWTEKAAASCPTLPAPFRPEARSRPAVCHSRGVTTLTTPEAIVHAELERKSLPFPYRYTCWPTPFTPTLWPCYIERVTQLLWVILSPFWNTHARKHTSMHANVQGVKDNSDARRQLWIVRTMKAAGLLIGDHPEGSGRGEMNKCRGDLKCHNRFFIMASYSAPLVNSCQQQSGGWNIHM